ncbi:PD-(D/E)XK nuclease-like domain-containing protein [Vibrio hannami]|uniref:PD-(D/E)XK nuclease-like domain-containing protein n=1 Tax=Vibrio hannami TaxID=2717094 RepID=UPI0024107DCD|nr:PD-(D/E)XK nuclease-like domain-containing protein [Vibrio hannami]MDG3089198.1 PD-(D/E)XK nuclease-like domain-containing protein [Vibrio hannami]
MQSETPADVWALHLLNPDRWEKPETDALRLGRAMAAFVEGGIEQVLAEYILLPEDTPRRPTEAQRAKYEAGQGTPAGTLSCEFWDKIDSSAKSILKPDDLEMITNMGTALVQDEAAVAVMGGIPEVTMAWRDEETGLWLLARPDTIAFDGTVTDYKKISSKGCPFNRRLVDRRIDDHRYDMQLAFAAEVYERLTGDWPEMAAIIAQHDKPPFSVILREIEQEDLRIGQFHNRQSIRRFAECLASGHWLRPSEPTLPLTSVRSGCVSNSLKK